LAVRSLHFACDGETAGGLLPEVCSAPAIASVASFVSLLKKRGVSPVDVSSISTPEILVCIEVRLILPFF